MWNFLESTATITDDTRDRGLISLTKKEMNSLLDDFPCGELFIDIAPPDFPLESLNEVSTCSSGWSDTEDHEVEQFSQSLFADLGHIDPYCSMSQIPASLYARPVSVTSSVQSSDVSAHSEQSTAILQPEPDSVASMPMKKRRWLADPDSDYESTEEEAKEDEALTAAKSTPKRRPQKKRKVLASQTKKAPPSKPTKPTPTTATSSSETIQSGHDTNWAKSYQALEEYYHRHGHSNVPNYCTEYPVLARWVKRQRFQYRAQQKGTCQKMTLTRIAAMERLDFVWDTQALAWSKRLADLQNYVDQHGHASVPTRHVNQSLAIWVKSQRRQYKKYRQGQHSTLTDERVTQLNALGFEWNMRPYKKE